MKNNAYFDAAELYTLFGSESLVNIDAQDNFTGVSTDSRSIEKENIFVALKGEVFDGHDKVEEAFGKGASCCIVSRERLESLKELLPHGRFIAVDDTLSALGTLANAYRSRFSLKIFAVAGSNGKTTTKEMIASVLSKKYSVLKTHANFNNRIGVPLMLFGIMPEHEVAVLEIGTNEPGEIFTLARMTEPTDGLITNIGREHLEKLIDIDGVEIEETSLFAYIRKHNGYAYINSDDTRLVRYQALMDNKLTYGTGDEAQIHAVVNYTANLNPVIEFRVNEEKFTCAMQTYGRGSALAAIAAASAGVRFEVPHDKIKEALEEFEAQKGQGYGRMFVEKKGNFKIINDCYNANPESMILALDTLSSFAFEGKKIAILGEMRELGEASAEEHINIIDKAGASGIQTFLIGKEFEKTFSNSASRYGNLTLVPSKDDIAELLVQETAPCLVLIKGSRGMRMEEIIEKIGS